MERVHGVTLYEWVETRGAMPFEQFVPFFECVAEVVQAAHERGIVHRDLKPRGGPIRALRALDRRGLARAGGGDAAPLFESGRGCPAPAVVATAPCG
jgi:hypothetical protein